MAGGERVVVLVDGEHYPAVLRAALRDLRAAGTEPVAAIVLGGTEKVAGYGADLDLGVRTEWVPGAAGSALDTAAAAVLVERAVCDLRPAAVVDLSDDPPLDARRRMQLAARVLALGLPYRTPDAVFTPPPRPRLATRPTVAVIGTGKRTGKTAVAGALTRRLIASGQTPVVVAMGRGGPEQPVVVPAGGLGAADLLAVADAGGHAASDFYEDAVTTGAATVGARRCGGGLAGAVGHSNVAEAVRLADATGGDLLVLEGSGASVPPVHADATLLVVPADIDPELLHGYLGAYRLLLADLVVVTMAESPRSTPSQTADVLRGIRSISRGTVVLRTVLRPEPLEDITGASVFLATTAPSSVGAALASSLETRFGCEVVGVSHRLADRPGLRADLAAAAAHEVLLVELKAAAVDVAARTATEVGTRVVFCDNRPVVVGIDPPDEAAGTLETVFDEAVDRIAGLASERFDAR